MTHATSDRFRARRIIHHLGSTGTPPEEGIERYTVGLDRYLSLLADEYFRFLGDGLSTFKLVVGTYGGGKTHFLLSVRNQAWQAGGAVAYLTLNPQESPFDKLELVYRRITDTLQLPPTDELLPERGLESVLRAWHAASLERFRAVDPEGAHDEELTASVLAGLGGLESTSYRNALAGAFVALQARDEATFLELVQHLKGEGADRDFLRRHKVFEPIDRTTAFRAIRSLAQFIRRIGHAGLVLLMDEAERMVSLASSRHQRTAVDNLRQFIDECGASSMEGVFLFYAVPREELLFGTGGGAVYEALRQRVRGVFTELNPSGVKIDLERLDLPATRFLLALGKRLAELYEEAYGTTLAAAALAQLLERFAQAAYEHRYGDEGYRRLFVKAFIQALHRLHRVPDQPFEPEEIEAILRGQTGSVEAADEDREF